MKDPTQPDLFDYDGPRDPPSDAYVYSGCPPTHRHAGAAERAAAEAIAASFNQIRQKIWDIARRPEWMEQGINVKEALRTYAAEEGIVGDAVGTLRNSVGPRLSELADAGLMRYDGKIRRERCGSYFVNPDRQHEDVRHCRRAKPSPKVQPHPGNTKSPE